MGFHFWWGPVESHGRRKSAAGGPFNIVDYVNLLCEPFMKVLEAMRFMILYCWEAFLDFPKFKSRFWGRFARIWRESLVSSRQCQHLKGDPVFKHKGTLVILGMYWVTLGSHGIGTCILMNVLEGKDDGRCVQIPRCQPLAGLEARWSDQPRNQEAGREDHQWNLQGFDPLWFHESIENCWELNVWFLQLHKRVFFCWSRRTSWTKWWKNWKMYASKVLGQQHLFLAASLRYVKKPPCLMLCPGSHKQDESFVQLSGGKHSFTRPGKCGSPKSKFQGPSCGNSNLWAFFRKIDGCKGCFWPNNVIPFCFFRESVLYINVFVGLICIRSFYKTPGILPGLWRNLLWINLILRLTNLFLALFRIVNE